MKNKIQILDGGMGRELLRIGAPFAQPEWSALALMQAPDMVARAHRHFIDAGAEIITANTYALIPFHVGHDKDIDDLARLAVTCAKNAVGDDDIKLAGCIPPAFGSYQPELFIADHLDPILTPLILAQKDDIDFWLVETMSSAYEAEATINIIKKHSDLPIHVSFTLNNRDDLSQVTTLRSGEELDLIEPILTHIDAVLFNCSQPEEMEDAIKGVRTMGNDIQIGAYANNFSEIKRTVDANKGISQSRDDITPEVYLEFAKIWMDSGATIIGGCCGITPEHISLLAKNLK